MLCVFICSYSRRCVIAVLLVILTSVLLVLRLLGANLAGNLLLKGVLTVAQFVLFIVGTFLFPGFVVFLFIITR